MSSTEIRKTVTVSKYTEVGVAYPPPIPLQEQHCLCILPCAQQEKDLCYSKIFWGSENLGPGGGGGI